VTEQALQHERVLDLQVLHDAYGCQGCRCSQNDEIAVAVVAAAANFQKKMKKRSIQTRLQPLLHVMT
jgi:hypothetical protein